MYRTYLLMVQNLYFIIFLGSGLPRPVPGPEAGGRGPGARGRGRGTILLNPTWSESTLNSIQLHFQPPRFELAGAVPSVEGNNRIPHASMAQGPADFAHALC